MSLIGSTPKKPQAYEVDTYERLQEGDVPRDQLGNHHVPQKAPARLIVPGFPQDKSAKSAPAIRLPADEHMAITVEQARRTRERAKMTPRRLLADDLAMLRRYTRAPRAMIQKLSAMAREAYDFAKP